MIPAAFDYVAPETTDQAVMILQESGDEAKVLAGGHSLLPLMKLRLAAPALLVDIGRIATLRSIDEWDGILRIGALVRYVDLKLSETVRSKSPLLSQAASMVGDAQVRNRGTLGGALAHADPAGDMPTVITALGGTIETASPAGGRSIPVGEFFRDIFETVLTPDELITEIRIPVDRPMAQHYEKFRRRLCDWAIVGVACNVRLDADGVVTSAAVVLTNVGPTPVRAASTEAALVGLKPSVESLAQAAARASEGLDPTPELNAPPEYKQHLAAVLTLRALNRALNRDGGTPT